MAKQEHNSLQPLSLGKLRKDLQLIMNEIDRTNGTLPDYYSPVMWQRLQNTAEKIANAIQAVRMKLSGMTTEQIANTLGLTVCQVAGYLAWNTMLNPGWLKPQVVLTWVACPKCNAAQGEPCRSSSAAAHKIHPARCETFKESAAGQAYLQGRADLLGTKYGSESVA